MNKIKKEQLPEGILAYREHQKEFGGTMKLNYESIVAATITNGFIASCKYFEDNTELIWFTEDGIFYIFVNGRNECYYEDGRLTFI